MTQAENAGPGAKTNWMGLLAMLVVGLVLGVLLDRAFLGSGPLLAGKPKLVGKWVGVANQDSIEFNADGSFAYEIPAVDMSGGEAKVTGGSRVLTKWKWVDEKTIELERGYFGEKNVKWEVMLEGDLLRLKDSAGTVKEYQRR
jgi:hypothetical protein